jgi:predicted RNA-binding protein YlxR (DUF448 family)
MIKNMRRCAQCRTPELRQHLVQIKYTDAGFVQLFEPQYLPGRSLYLCSADICWKKAAKNKGLLKGEHRPYREAWLRFLSFHGMETKEIK